MNQLSSLIISIFLIFAPTAEATFIDLNTLYYSDGFATDTTTQISHSAWDIGVGFEVGANKRMAIALNFGGVSQSEKDSVTKTFANTDTGLKLFYFWTKQKTWSSTLSYNLVSKAKYNDGTSEVELRGTSLKADFGYNFWLGEYSALALKVYYYKPTFTESVSSTTISTVNYSRTTIHPGLGFVYLF
jgi:hypothetical protein